MVSAEREPITGVWGRAPAGVQGQRAEPPVGGQGSKAPLKLKAFLYFACLQEAANLAHD